MTFEFYVSGPVPERLNHYYDPNRVGTLETLLKVRYAQTVFALKKADLLDYDDHVFTAKCLPIVEKSELRHDPSSYSLDTFGRGWQWKDQIPVSVLDEDGELSFVMVGGRRRGPVAVLSLLDRYDRLPRKSPQGRIEPYVPSPSWEDMDEIQHSTDSDKGYVVVWRPLGLRLFATSGLREAQRFASAFASHVMENGLKWRAVKNDSVSFWKVLYAGVGK